MAVKRLTTGEMLSLTSSWVQKNHKDRATLASNPAVQPLLSHVEDAHHSLLNTQVDSAPPPRLIAIQNEQKGLDDRHDDIVRGIYYMLIALAYLTTDAELSQRLIALQQKLFPEGLAATQKSYRDEAGQAALLKRRIEPADTELLKTIRVFDDNLNDFITELLQIGSKLGVLEDERTAAEAAPGASPSDAVAARNQWIRAINAVVSVASLKGEPTGPLKVILDRIGGAERRAARRVATAAKLPADPGAEPPESSEGEGGEGSKEP